MVLALLLFLVAVYSQDCSKLQHGGGNHHAVVFGDFDAKGSADGSLVIGGSAKMQDFSAGWKLTDEAEYALVVNKDLFIQCGSFFSNIFHGGTIDVGARVDFQGYNQEPANIDGLYKFDDGEAYYTTLAKDVAALDRRAFGTASLQTGTLRLVGTMADTEFFHVSCEDMSATQRIEYQSINPADTTSIVINVGNSQDTSCTYDVPHASTTGLHFVEPTGHILWNVVAPEFKIKGDIIGSLLAPNTAISTEDPGAYIQGQTIVRTASGVFPLHMGANLFRGCLPTDPCQFINDAHCPKPVPIPPTDCIGPEAVMNPDDVCCVLTYTCLENCEQFVCPTVDLVCVGNYKRRVVLKAGQKGGHPCCPTYACMPADGAYTFLDVGEDDHSSKCCSNESIWESLGESEISYSDNYEFRNDDYIYNYGPLSMTGPEGWGIRRPGQTDEDFLEKCGEVCDLSDSCAGFMAMDQQHFCEDDPKSWKCQLTCRLFNSCGPGFFVTVQDGTDSRANGARSEETDRWACYPKPPSRKIKPLCVSCPKDIKATIPLGAAKSVTVEWDEPQFLYVRSVSSTHTSPSVFGVGRHIVAYNGVGFKPNTQIGCYFSIVVPEPTLSGCEYGGQSYDEGDSVIDSCMQKCVCEKGSLKQCKRVRYELTGLAQEFRAQYWSAWKTAYNAPDNYLRDQINNHLRFFSRGLHNTGTFLPWHRGYILGVENYLNNMDCRMTIPYWDWSIDTRILRNNIFGEAAHQCSGNGDSRRCVSTGTFGFNNGFSLTSGRCLQRRMGGGSAAPKTAMVGLQNRYTQARQFDSFRNRLEHGPGMHDSVHCLVGGTMCSARSSNDPVFFSHHANIDKSWDTWQTKSDAHKMEYTGSTPLNSLMPTSIYTPAQMLDLQSLPGDLHVIYYVSDIYENLDSVISMMTEEELSSIGKPELGGAGLEWFHAMNMATEDIDTIREAEKIANVKAVKDAVVATLKNGVERTLGLPGLNLVIKHVANRLAIQNKAKDSCFDDDDALKPECFDPEDLFRALANTFVEQDMVPRFYELQEILIEEDGVIIDSATVAQPITCATADIPVCAGGQQFANPCEAQQVGFDVQVNGDCPKPPDLQESLDPSIDGGESDAYNHHEQENALCPPTQPIHMVDECTPNTIGTVCYYGLVCCQTNQKTATCVDGRWRISDLGWATCEQAEPCDTARAADTAGENVLVVTLPPASTLAPTTAPASTLAPTKQSIAQTQNSGTQSSTSQKSTRRTSTLTITTSAADRAAAAAARAQRQAEDDARRAEALALARSAAQAQARREARDRQQQQQIAEQVRQAQAQAQARRAQAEARRVEAQVRAAQAEAERVAEAQALLSLLAAQTISAPTSVCAEIVCPTPPTCCEEGSTVQTQQIPVGDTTCDGCQVCLDESNAVTRTPYCCRPGNTCVQQTPFLQEHCNPGENLVLVIPRSNQPGRCCDQFRCQAKPCDPEADCPQIPQCQPFERADFHPTLTLIGLPCCRAVRCVFDACTTEPRPCDSGSVVHRNPLSNPPCLFDPCPVACLNPNQILSCPISGGMVDRQRNSADAPNGPCEWQPCPDYEPCTDTALELPNAGNGNLCTANGECVLGRTELTCRCHENWSGPRCLVFTAPERPKFDISDRSFGLGDNCLPIMCVASKCKFTQDYGMTWPIIDANGVILVAYAGLIGTETFFLDEEGHVGKITGLPAGQVQWQSTASEDDTYRTALTNGNIEVGRTDYSYLTAREGVPPSPSESNHILNYGTKLGTAPCTNHIYLTQEHVTIYTATHSYSTEWSSTSAADGANQAALCEDKCYDIVTGTRELCNGVGTCDRETGTCWCEFGFDGPTCLIDRRMRIGDAQGQ